ncbi:type VI secretion protein [Haloglycomyces albus]|uniref:type VI secretion protein n=1 Tax=Haloglycomyces albus TaxID=526067 RepID=UPI0004B3EA2A|nr:type VI secretion protein [Haloglycomyces albus]
MARTKRKAMRQRSDAATHAPIGDLGLDKWTRPETDNRSNKNRDTHAARSRRSRVVDPAPPRRGRARPWSGRASPMPTIPVHRGSTAQVAGLYPWLYGQTLPAVGPYIGVDCQSGGSFSCHPIEWVVQGYTTNPNFLVTGIPGAGKSATVKSLAFRLMAYGIKTFILGDLKNEYAPVARAVGVEPVAIGPGLSARLNPLDAGPLGRRLPADKAALDERLREIHRRRISLLSALMEMRLGRRLTTTEERATSLAIKETSGEADGNTTLVDPTIPQVWALLRDPTDDMVTELRYASVSALREAIRPAADGLGNMIQGSLAGLFDDHTTVAPDFDAPMQTVDLSRLKNLGDDIVAMTLACVSTWGESAIDDPNGPVRLVVRDELWRAMRIPAMVSKLDSDLRLSRAQGTIQMLCTHRLSDFDAVGPADSEEVAIARGLASSCDIRVCLAQDSKPLGATQEAFGLTDIEVAQVLGFSSEFRGRALWKVGGRYSHIVQTILSGTESRLFDTNERMVS